MAYYDIQITREKYMYTVQADSEEQAEEYALSRANWDYGNTHSHITEVSSSEVDRRHAAKHWKNANTH
jgi:hypothetical protein